MTTTMTQLPQKPKSTFRQTLTDLVTSIQGAVTSFQQAPVNPVQHILRRTIAGDDFLQDQEYELNSAIGTLENTYQTMQKETFEVLKQNLKLERTLDESGIPYNIQKETPIIIRYNINTALTAYSPSDSYQKNKAAKMTVLHQKVEQLELEYETVAQELESQKTQRTYLALKVALHGIEDPFAKDEVNTYKDAIATFLEETNKAREAKNEQARKKIASVRIIGELYAQNYTLSGNYDAKTLEKIHTPENVRAYFHNSAELEQTVSSLADPTKKTDYATRKENRLKLTDLIKQHPEYQTAAFNIAKGIATTENALAEEVGIALANATNQSQYWQFVGDLIGASPTAQRPDRMQWQQQCYEKAK